MILKDLVKYTRILQVLNWSRKVNNNSIIGSQNDIDNLLADGRSECEGVRT